MKKILFIILALFLQSCTCIDSENNIKEDIEVKKQLKQVGKKSLFLESGVHYTFNEKNLIEIDPWTRVLKHEYETTDNWSDFDDWKEFWNKKLKKSVIVESGGVRFLVIEPGIKKDLPKDAAYEENIAMELSELEKIENIDFHLENYEIVKIPVRVKDIFLEKYPGLKDENFYMKDDTENYTFNKNFLENATQTDFVLLKEFLSQKPYSFPVFYTGKKTLGKEYISSKILTVLEKTDISLKTNRKLYRVIKSVIFKTKEQISQETNKTAKTTSIYFLQNLEKIVEILDKKYKKKLKDR